MTDKGDCISVPVEQLIDICIGSANVCLFVFFSSVVVVVVVSFLHNYQNMIYFPK